MGRITGKVKTNVNILQFICIHKHYIYLADENRSTAITVFLSLFTDKGKYCNNLLTKRLFTQK